MLTLMVFTIRHALFSRQRYRAMRYFFRRAQRGAGIKQRYAIARHDSEMLLRAMRQRIADIVTLYAVEIYAPLFDAVILSV